VRGGGHGGRRVAEWVLVLEDDVELRHNFVALMLQRLETLKSIGQEWDFICVGS
jgi:GT2 family glycosyltransferase